MLYLLYALGVFSMTINNEQKHKIGTATQFIVKHNQSLSWQGNKLFIVYIAILSFGIAIFFALQGLWLILPFAGLEILALTVALYICNLRGREREVITIEPEKLVIEKGLDSPKHRWQFERAWLNLELKKSSLQGHPNKLLVRCKGIELEIGKCLSNSERKELAKTLVSALDKSLIYT